MKYKFLAITVIILVFLGLILLPRFIKKDTSKAKVASGIPEQTRDSVNVDSYLKEAEAFVDKGSLLEAKEIYQRLLDLPLSSKQMSIVQAKSENLNIKILLSGVNIDKSQIYEVKPGDALVNIAKKFNTTVEAIVKSNNIKNDIIRPGKKLRILNGKFSIFIDKSQNIMMLKFDDEVAKTYSISTGKNNSTPIGTYKIINKIINPPWYKDGKEIPPSSPENILGSRWMGFDLPGYGIHGTIAPQDIGSQITEGCVRMKNEDVEEIYSLVPIGTEVTIID